MEQVNIYKTLFSRNVVIEEGTGTGCSWCVKGIVAMEKMREEHPYDFIGIAVHNNDPLTVPEYDSSIGFTNFPSCNVDRTLMRQSVEPDFFETYYQFEKMQNAVGAIYATASPAADGKTLHIDLEAEFAYDGHHDYNYAIVLTEDGVEGFPQKNAFAGGAYGEMGGFENMGDPVLVPHNEVARGIYPAYEGALLTSEVARGSLYKYGVDISVPDKVQHASKLYVVALLIDAATGRIVNADRIHAGLTDVEKPDDPDDPDKPATGNYRYVDLGLSVVWSDANMLGSDDNFGQASAPEIFGGYFGWADPTGMLTAADDSLYPAATDLPTDICGTDLDIARAKWGGQWRLPSQEEVAELYNSCTVSYPEVNGVQCLKLTSVHNGESILLPFNGGRYEEMLGDQGLYGSYWTGTLYPEAIDDIWYAYDLDFDMYAINVKNVAYRYDGCGVRPVCDKSELGVKNLGVTGDAVVSTEYYSLDGIRLKVPSTGLMLRRDIMSDGSVQVSKILKR